MKGEKIINFTGNTIFDVITLSEQIAISFTILNPVNDEDENANPVLLKITTNIEGMCYYGIDASPTLLMDTSDNITFTEEVSLSTDKIYNATFFCNTSGGFNDTQSILFNYYQVTGGGAGSDDDVGQKKKKKWKWKKHHPQFWKKISSRKFFHWRM